MDNWFVLRRNFLRKHSRQKSAVIWTRLQTFRNAETRQARCRNATTVLGCCSDWVAEMNYGCYRYLATVRTGLAGRRMPNHFLSFRELVTFNHVEMQPTQKNSEKLWRTVRGSGNNLQEQITPPTTIVHSYQLPGIIRSRNKNDYCYYFRHL